MAHSSARSDTAGSLEPRLIRMHPADNVAIVANDLGLPAGTRISQGLVTQEAVPQGHKVALSDIAKGAPVRRYDVVIGYAAEALAAGAWVNEKRLIMPSSPPLDDLPIATRNTPLPPLDGYSFQGFRNANGSMEGPQGLVPFKLTGPITAYAT